MTPNSKRQASRNRRGNGARAVTAEAELSATDAQPGCLELSDEDLFEDLDLADTIAAITGKRPKSAEEFTMYLLIIRRAFGPDLPEQIRRTVDRSVVLAFQFTSTYRAALELYTSGQFGYPTGHLSAEDLIREAITSKVQR